MSPFKCLFQHSLRANIFIVARDLKGEIENYIIWCLKKLRLIWAMSKPVIYTSHHEFAVYYRCLCVGFGQLIRVMGVVDRASHTVFNLNYSDFSTGVETLNIRVANADLACVNELQRKLQCSRASGG